MKQTIMLVIVTAMIIVGGIWENNYLNTSSQYFLSDINYSKNAVNNNDFELAKKHFKETEDTWNSMQGVWNILLDHSEIDKIEEAMDKYKTYIEYENGEQAMVYANVLDNNLRHIVETEKINVYNIF